MDNPFMVGDLVHIPIGVFLYADAGALWPRELTKEVTSGVITKPAINGVYEIYVAGFTLYVRKEDVFLIHEKRK